jgi:hypothetical protein
VYLVRNQNIELKDASFEESRPAHGYDSSINNLEPLESHSVRHQVLDDPSGIQIRTQLPMIDETIVKGTVLMNRPVCASKQPFRQPNKNHLPPMIDTTRIPQNVLSHCLTSDFLRRYRTQRFSICWTDHIARAPWRSFMFFYNRLRFMAIRLL